MCAGWVLTPELQEIGHPDPYGMFFAHRWLSLHVRPRRKRM